MGRKEQRVTKEKIAAMCLRLPANERAELLADLAASLDESTDPGAEERWAAEIARRVDLFNKGKYTERSAASVLRKARARAR